jgi:hypothetical protein
MRNELVIALLLLAQPAAASTCAVVPWYRMLNWQVSARQAEIAALRAPTTERVGRSPVALAGDPDSPMDSVRPIALFTMGPGRLRLVLPSRSQVTVDVFAVNGRRVGGRDLGLLEAGSHELADLGLGRVSKGVYLARVRAGAGLAQAKFIKL